MLIANKNVLDSNLKRWTENAIFCYERNCICKNCHIQKILGDRKCQMKYYVIASVCKFGIPKKKGINYE